jgi:hypothetical protein
MDKIQHFRNFDNFMIGDSINVSKACEKARHCSSSPQESLCKNCTDILNTINRIYKSTDGQPEESIQGLKLFYTTKYRESEEVYKQIIDDNIQKITNSDIKITEQNGQIKKSNESLKEQQQLYEENALKIKDLLDGNNSLTTQNTTNSEDKVVFQLFNITFLILSRKVYIVIVFILSLLLILILILYVRNSVPVNEVNPT